jgi:hypothetical protein
MAAKTTVQNSKRESEPLLRFDAARGSARTFSVACLKDDRWFVCSWGHSKDDAIDAAVQEIKSGEWDGVKVAPTPPALEDTQNATEMSHRQRKD